MFYNIFFKRAGVFFALRAQKRLADIAILRYIRLRLCYLRTYFCPHNELIVVFVMFKPPYVRNVIYEIENFSEQFLELYPL